MATVTGLTSERMMELYGYSITAARMVGDHLVLTTYGGADIDVGSIRGPQGVVGPTGFMPVDITVSFDWNTLTAPGTYLIRHSVVAGGCTNGPVIPGFTSGVACHIIVEGNGVNYFKQTITNYNNPSEQAVRTYYNSTWYGWSLPVENGTTAQVGLLQLATTTEAQAGTDTAKALTVAAMVARTAATTRTGLVQLATAAEVTTGTDAFKAVTPLTLQSMTGYRYLQTVKYTSSGTFTKASYPGAKAIRVRVQGGGGGGGGAMAPAASQHTCGGGGGAGGYAEAFVLASALATSETVTVGRGGAAGASAASTNVGGTGGTSSLGTKVSASGGLGGETAVTTTLMVCALGGAGGAGSIGDVLATGAPGIMGSGYATLGNGGAGGSSMFGGGALGTYNGGGGASTVGNTGNLYGGGGGGAQSNGGSAANGGAGAAGIVIVEVYI